MIAFDWLAEASLPEMNQDVVVDMLSSDEISATLLFHAIEQGVKLSFLLFALFVIDDSFEMFGEIECLRKVFFGILKNYLFRLRILIEYLDDFGHSLLVKRI